MRTIVIVVCCLGLFLLQACRLFNPQDPYEGHTYAKKYVRLYFVDSNNRNLVGDSAGQYSPTSITFNSGSVHGWRSPNWKLSDFGYSVHYLLYSQLTVDEQDESRFRFDIFEQVQLGGKIENLRIVKDNDEFIQVYWKDSLYSQLNVLDTTVQNIFLKS